MRFKNIRISLGAVTIVGVLGVFGCQGWNAAAQKEAERQVVAVRDLEEELGDLPRAIQRYREIAQEFSGTKAGRRAKERYLKLLQVEEILAEIEVRPKEDQLAAYRKACTLLPDYPPSLRKVGVFNFNRTYLYSRTAAKLKDKLTANDVVEVWNEQDRLWSQYTFRATALDREWRDRLCRQAVEVARMLEAFRRYSEASEIVDRGLEYAANEDVKAHARVFASFYTFRKARFKAAIKLAEKALAYEFLSREDRSRAYHTIGLSYTYIHEDTGQLSDLDAGIKALNEAVLIDSSMAEAKRMLKVLRIQRERLYL